MRGVHESSSVWRGGPGVLLFKQDEKILAVPMGNEDNTTQNHPESRIEGNGIYERKTQHYYDARTSRICVSDLGLVYAQKDLPEFATVT